jgi:hypothetical protein
MAMGNMISPGVYTRIIDLSEYLADIPGTVGFLPILSRRGPDNKLQFVSSKEQFINMYGDPNILDYGKYYGQGPYVAWQHLNSSSHLYVLRALPDDATYAHLIIGMQKGYDIVDADYSSSTDSQSFEKLEMVAIHCTGENRYYYEKNEAGDGYNKNGFTTPSINHVRELDTLLSLEATSGTGADTIYGPDSYMTTDIIDGEVENTYDASQSEADALGDMSLGTGGLGERNGFLMYFRTIGRGSSYNDFSIRLGRHANPEMFGVYILDIYEVQPDGDKMIVESFNVSFDVNMVDDAGESLFIEDVVNKFSANILCKVNRNALRKLEEFKVNYYRNDPTLPEDVAALDGYTEVDVNGEYTNNGYKASKIEYAKMDYDYATSMLEEAIGALELARDLDSSTSEETTTRNDAITAAITLVSEARNDADVTKNILEDAYLLDIMDMGEADSSISQIDSWTLDEGSEGSLVYLDQNTGRTIVSTDIADKCLSEAYLGLLERPDNPVNSVGTWKRQFVDEVYDLDWIYFSLVYDAGYPVNVKTSAFKLCDEIRRDCMLVTDCGDNIDYDDVENFVGGNINSVGALSMNSRYAARYEPYSKVYDVFTGRDLWLSPVYHMAQTIPLNDRLYEIWSASAGFNRGTLTSIKELRWSAKLGERDKLYLNQVNPIVHFPQGYTIWGNLTTQKRPTALQDINCMRLVLYVKRALEQYCKYFIFEFNDNNTHAQIKAGILPFLDRIKAKRGLVSYSVDVGATDYEFKNKICHVNVTLTPMKVIEKIELNLFIK